MVFEIKTYHKYPDPVICIVVKAKQTFNCSMAAPKNRDLPPDRSGKPGT